MGNLMLEEVEYKTEQTKLGVWRRYVYSNGTAYHEFRSYASFFGLPLIHYTYGRNPEIGGRVVAKGIIAVGRFACGVVAIGHVCLGLLAIGQLAVGLIFGLGQLATGVLAVGQFALGGLFGLGQFATGYIAIGQLAWGQYILAQAGKGDFAWTMERADPEAVRFFKALPVVREFLR